MGKKFADIEYLLRIPVVFWHGRYFNLVNFGIFASIGSMTGHSICFFYLYAGGVPVARYCWVIALVLYVFTILFAKLFAVFSIGLSEYLRNFRYYFNRTNFYHQGGLIGSMIGSILLCLLLKIPFPLLGDALCLGGLVMMSIGRIGCHEYGCCAGKPSNGSFAILYKDPDARICTDHPGLHNTPLIPVQLISALTDLMVFMGCCLIAIHIPVSGLIMVIFVVVVNLKRIVIQRFRIKAPRNNIPYELVASLIFAFAVLIMLVFHHLGSTFFEKHYPVIPFTFSGYFRFLVSDPNIIASLIFIAVINFIAYGIHGRIIGTHTNLVR